MFNDSMFSKVITLASALLTGKCVSKERMEKRVEICRTCPLVKFQGNDETALPYCGVCGCKVRGDRTLINLARFEETSKYGCKFPDPATNQRKSKWKEAGV